jgi:hypothetical protein
MTIGWSSLESVSAIHRLAEIAGFVFLGLLLMSEIVAYVSGNRKDELQEQLAQRRLTPEQRGALLAALSPFKGQKASVFCVLGDGEGKRFADDFVSVLIAAQWDLGPKPGVDQGVYDKDPIGIEPTLNQGEVSAGRIPQAFSVLINTLGQLHLIKAKQAFANPETQVGLIELRIGRKP